MYTFGQPVEINWIWAGGMHPLRTWTQGARFYRFTDDGYTAVVFKRFLGSWVRFRYPSYCVRSATQPST